MKLNNWYFCKKIQKNLERKQEENFFVLVFVIQVQKDSIVYRTAKVSEYFEYFEKLIG